MKKVTTILCAFAFMISGIMLAIPALDRSRNTGYSTVAAATLSSYNIPNNVNSIVALPQDLSSGLAEKSVLDTVYITKTDTIKEQVTKVKWRKVRVPTSVVNRDTVHVPVYYIATRVDKEGSTGECTPVYELKQVDRLCPEIINSSVQSINELNSDVVGMSFELSTTPHAGKQSGCGTQRKLVSLTYIANSTT